MAETKEITRLHVVTDSETSYDNIGDIDGGMFDEVWLASHISRHGTEGLLEKLGGMVRQVMNAKHDFNRINSEILNADAIKSPVILCGQFIVDPTTSSATMCMCGRNKWEHPKEN